jgi:hypothetical protein
MKVFYRHLPVEDMVCDVSLFTSKVGSPPNDSVLDTTSTVH